MTSWACRESHSIHSPDWWEDGPGGRLSSLRVPVFAFSFKDPSAATPLPWSWVSSSWTDGLTLSPAGWLRCGSFGHYILNLQDTAAGPKPHTSHHLTAKFPFTHLCLPHPPRLPTSPCVSCVAIWFLLSGRILPPLSSQYSQFLATIIGLTPLVGSCLGSCLVLPGSLSDCWHLQMIRVQRTGVGMLAEPVTMAEEWSGTRKSSLVNLRSYLVVFRQLASEVLLPWFIRTTPESFNTANIGFPSPEFWLKGHESIIQQIFQNFLKGLQHAKMQRPSCNTKSWAGPQEQS